MDAVQLSAWAGGAFAPQSSDPEFAHPRLPEQLASSSDPVVTPAFVRSAPARYQPPQQQQGFNPAAPLLSFVTQESQEYESRPQIPAPAAVILAASAAVVSDDDTFLNDVLAQQQEDNKPVGIYSAPATAALWPELNAPPVVPGKALPSALDSVLALPFLLPSLCCRQFSGVWVTFRSQDKRHAEQFNMLHIDRPQLLGTKAH